MRFDDTLETVLAADVSTPFGKASAWRQLVDLIGRRRIPAEHRALSLLESIRGAVPVAVRAASARALELAQPPFALVKLCATDDIAVAAPVLRGAMLNSGEWIELLPRLSAAGRTVVRDRRDLPPGVDAALATFTVDFVIEGEVAVAVAEVPVEVPDETADITTDAADFAQDDLADVAVELPGEPVPLIAETSDETAPLALAAVAIPLSEPYAEWSELLVDWTEVVDARPAPHSVSVEAVPAIAEVIIDWTDVVARRPAEPRPRIRIRPVLEADTLARPTPEAETISVAEAVEDIPTTPSTFVTVGAAALSIPVVAAAIKQAGEDEPVAPETALTQSETGDEPLAAATLAPESEVAHDSPMSGEETILADRDGAAADTGLRPLETALSDAPEGPFEIADVVARIDAFYTRQQDHDAVSPIPAHGAGFRFETDDQGVIRWVDGVARGPLIGLSLDMTAMPDGSRVDGVAAGAFRRRGGFSDARLIVAGESDAAGDWRISGTAAFDPATGRFSGYRGTARRPRTEENPAVAASDNRAADSLRQLMHELRTPTNAIAGFAEMIEREMLGEAPAIYRERAGTIRYHARALLAAIDDLDIAARIEASALRLQTGEVALRPLLARIADDLGALAEMRGAWIALPIDNLTIAGDARAVERLLSRLLATLVSAAGEGERVEVRLAAESDDSIAITCDRPQALRAYAGEAIFGIDDEREDAALLGTGFALRLVRNLARELSGAFVIEADSLTLRLPAAVTKSLEVMR